MPIITPHLNTFSNTLGFGPKPKFHGQSIRFKHKNPKTSSANQNRVSQRRKNTREITAPGRSFSALSSSRLAIVYLNTFGLPPPPPPPPGQLTLLLLVDLIAYSQCFFFEQNCSFHTKSDCVYSWKWLHISGL